MLKFFEKGDIYAGDFSNDSLPLGAWKALVALLYKVTLYRVHIAVMRQFLHSHQVHYGCPAIIIITSTIFSFGLYGHNFKVHSSTRVFRHVPRFVMLCSEAFRRLQWSFGLRFEGCRRSIAVLNHWKQ
jgi:hypothetical protein